MRNGQVYLTKNIVKTISNYTGTSTMPQIPAAEVISSITNSGYTGPRVKAKPQPKHSFSYDAHNTRMLIEAFENINQPYGPETVRWSGGALKQLYNCPIVLLEDDTDLYNKLIEKLNEKARGTIDLSIDIAEAGKTKQMLKGIDSIENLGKQLQKKSGLLKIPGSLWLEYTYGWKPLLSTVYEAAEESTRVVINKLERFNARVVKNINDPLVSFARWDGAVMTCRAKGTSKISYSSNIALLTNDGFDVSRWSSLNPASIAWELTPYSFVVDWFYDVGGYLRNLETSLLYANRFNNGSISRIEAHDLTFKVDEIISLPGDYYSATYRGEHYRRKFSRTLLSSYPSPRIPRFKAELGSSRMLSAAALLSTLLK